MVIDTSILVAVILEENGYEEFVFKMAEADARYISAASYLEASVVLLKRRGQGVDLELDRLIYESEIVIIPVTAAHARIGRQAYLEYGKGMMHPAQLNLGDCFAYALSKQLGEPLLFKGGDFGQTDVESAS
jgi:ribonuclease VapC